MDAQDGERIDNNRHEEEDADERLSRAEREDRGRRGDEHGERGWREREDRDWYDTRGNDRTDHAPPRDYERGERGWRDWYGPRYAEREDRDRYDTHRNVHTDRVPPRGNEHGERQGHGWFDETRGEERTDRSRPRGDETYLREGRGGFDPRYTEREGRNWRDPRSDDRPADRAGYGPRDDELAGREVRGWHDSQAREKRVDRVIKSFNMETFDGSSQPGALDAGISAWLTRFEALLGTQEDLQGLRLPDRLKSALLFQHLRGVASQWYVANVHELRSRSFEHICGQIRSEFSSKLSNQQITLMVASERKRHAETYREYSLRLRAMAAAATPTGLETTESNNAALSSFIVNAWYKHTDNLRLVIHEDSNRPLREMERAIDKLCSIAGHQGIVKPSQTRSPGAMKTELKPTKVAPNQSRPTLGKRKVNFKNEGSFKRRDFSKAKCDTCGELGHTTGYHDKYIQLKQRGLAQAARASTSKSPREPDAGDVKEEDESFESSD